MNNKKYTYVNQVSIDTFANNTKLARQTYQYLRSMIIEAIKSRDNLLISGDGFRGVGKTRMLLEIKRDNNLITLVRRQSELKEPYTPLQLVLSEYNNKTSYKPIILVDDILEEHVVRLINQGNIVIGFVKRF